MYAVWHCKCRYTLENTACHQTVRARDSSYFTPFYRRLESRLHGIDSLSRTGYNAFIVSFVRFVIGLLFTAALLFTAGRGECAEQNIDQQIAERTRQYQESLRQRAAQLSPSLQTKIESQAEQTTAKGLKKLKNGELDIQIALPGWTEARRIAKFVARHAPSSGAPIGTLDLGIGTLHVALTVTSVQYVLKVLTMPIADSAIVRSLFVDSSRQNGGVLSYFIRVVYTIVQRR